MVTDRRRRHVRASAFSLAILLFGAILDAGTSAAAGGTPRARTKEPSRAAAASCQAPDVETFLISGRVHACGTSLVDGAGHRIRLLSYEMLSMYGGEGDVTPECGHWAAPPADLAAHVRKWGFNSVQILISWSNLEPRAPGRWPSGRVRHHWNKPYLAALDAAIAQFGAQGLKVVLGLGQSKWSQAFRNIKKPDGTIVPCGLGMPEWLYPGGGSTWAMVHAELRFFAGTDGVQAKFRHVWQMVARRYVGNVSVVAAGMLFEAPDMIAQPFLGRRIRPSALDLAGFYERTGHAIHHVAPSLLLLYADWQSRNTNPIYFAITRKPRLRSAAYSYEFYSVAWDADSRGRFDRYHRRAVSWNVPGWIDEFDAFEYGRRTDSTLPGDPHWRRDTLAMLARAKADRIGWSLVTVAMDYPLASAIRQGR
jgi:Cellulase (glycosyl hydrolase family 5)